MMSIMSRLLAVMKMQIHPAPLLLTNITEYVLRRDLPHFPQATGSLDD
jgi:hypothetical protein